MFLQIVTNTKEAAEELVQGVEQTEKTLSVWDLIFSSGVGGGIILFILLLLSIMAVYIIVEKFLSLKQNPKEEQQFMNQIKDFMLDGKTDAALALCRKSNFSIARMIEKGVTRIGRPLEDIATAIETIAKLELNKKEKNLSLLATISGAAPMIGFLGTVLGMVLVFHKMASAGGNINIEMLSQGIYTAMITTVAGLIVGLIAYIGYNTLVAKVEKIVADMETRTTEFVDILYTPVKH